MSILAYISISTRTTLILPEGSLTRLRHASRMSRKETTSEDVYESDRLISLGLE